MYKEYSREAEKIEAALRKALPDKPGAPWLEDIFFPRPDRPGPGEARPNLAGPLLEPAQDLFNRGGKRWRPLLAHLVCRALGGGDAALPFLPLVEFPHNASLIHDDLEDSSDERRGKPAVHLIYGNDTAINSGSFLYFLPLAVLEQADLPPEVKNRLWALWGEHMRLLHLGQSLDIAWHRSMEIPPVDDYIFMCGLKTGCLARFAALLGVELALTRKPPARKPGEVPVDELGGAAQKLGIAFQILDDVKNLGPGVAGKKRGDDVVEGKKSLPVLLFLHGISMPGMFLPEMEKAERAALARRCFTAARKGGAAAPEVEELIAALTEAGALTEAERQGRALLEEAGKTFAALPAEDKEAAKLLAGLTELLR